MLDIDRILMNSTYGAGWAMVDVYGNYCNPETDKIASLIYNTYFGGERVDWDKVPEYLKIEMLRGGMLPKTVRNKLIHGK
jgi:hypothetical protein